MEKIRMEKIIREYPQYFIGVYDPIKYWASTRLFFDPFDSFGRGLVANNLTRRYNTAHAPITSNDNTAHTPITSNEIIEYNRSIPMFTSETISKNRINKMNLSILKRKKVNKSCFFMY